MISNPTPMAVTHSPPLSQALIAALYVAVFVYAVLHHLGREFHPHSNGHGESLVRNARHNQMPDRISELRARRGREVSRDLAGDLRCDGAHRRQHASGHTSNGIATLCLKAAMSPSAENTSGSPEPAGSCTPSSLSKARNGESMDQGQYPHLGRGRFQGI